MIDGAVADEQALGFSKLSFDFVAVHFSVADVIEDRKFEQTLSYLICPVVKKTGIHSYQRSS